MQQEKEPVMRKEVMERLDHHDSERTLACSNAKWQYESAKGVINGKREVPVRHLYCRTLFRTSAHH